MMSIYSTWKPLNTEQLHNFHIGSVKNLGICQGSVCPCTLTQGSIKTLSISASNGIAPYTYHWTIIRPDGTIDNTPTQPTFSYEFGQQGNYAISGYVIDSCPTGSKISNTDSCIITVTPTPPFGGCTPPCTSTQSCILGTCVENNYIKYGTIGFGALLLLLLLK